MPRKHSSTHWISLAERIAANAAVRSGRLLEVGRVARLTGLKMGEVVLLARGPHDYGTYPDSSAAERALRRGTLRQQMALGMLLGEIPGDADAYEHCRNWVLKTWNLRRPEWWLRT